MWLNVVVPIIYDNKIKNLHLFLRVLSGGCIQIFSSGYYPAFNFSVQMNR